MHILNDTYSSLHAHKISLPTLHLSFYMHCINIIQILTKEFCSDRTAFLSQT